MLNQNLFDDEDRSYQLGFFPLHTNFTPLPFWSNKTFATIPPLVQEEEDDAPLLYPEPAIPQQKEEFISSFAGSPIFSLQKSTANYWVNDCMNTKRNGGDENLGVLPINMKKIKSRKKVREPRFCFKTMSDVDVLDDGYKWRKYGQKVVKNTQHPRSYYRCTQDNCRVKKRVERLAEDSRMVITTYEGRHIHSPSHDELDYQSSSQLKSLFW